MSLNKSLAAGALALALPMSAMAASDFKVNGFANAGYAWVDSDETYLFADKDGSFNESSHFGLQMRFSPNEDIPISFVMQLLAKGRFQWEVDADWAFINWQVNEKIGINLGRVKTPFFLISEAYDVGITYPWILPPEEIYGFANVPFTSVTGLSVDYSHYFDETWFNAKLVTGRDNGTVPAMSADIPVEVIRMVTLSLSVGGEAWEARVSASDVEFSMNIADALLALPVATAEKDAAGNAIVTPTALLALINAAEDGDPTAQGMIAAQAGIGVGSLTQGVYDAARAAQTAALAAGFAGGAELEALFGAIPNGQGETEFYSAGFRYDGEQVFFMTELARREIAGVPFPDTTSGFVTLGYRIDKMMPHFTYSFVDTEDSILVNQTQTSAILGLRYDIEPWAALKFEMQYTELGDDNVRESGPLVGSPLPSSGLFNELPDLTTFTGDVPDEVLKLQVALTMVF